MATAYRLAARGVGVAVYERGEQLGSGQSGHNSNVVHSGAFYRPDSMKARLAIHGRQLLEAFIEDNSLPYRRLGKLVVEQRGESERFDELARRATANGVAAEVLGSGAEIEPAVIGRRALWLPGVAVTDFGSVLEALADEVRVAGGEIFLGCNTVRSGGRLIANDREIKPYHSVVAAGLGFNELCPDRTWRVAGFKGAYRELVSPDVEHLVYAVPDPRYPFLGVHLTPGLGPEVTAGPTATIHPPIPLGRIALLGLREWRRGASELASRWFADRMWRDVRRYLRDAVLGREVVKTGIRAQAVDRAGRYADDFLMVDAPGITYVANAPSPAATACLAIGEHIAERVMSRERT